MIHFIRPEWLLALIPLALMFYLLRKDELQQSSWNRYIAPHLAKILISTSGQNSKNHIGILAFSWFIAVLALSGPALTKHNLPVFETNQGRVIIMDMSLSMYATDLAPNRLTQAKFKTTDLLKNLKEGETGLVAYAGEAFTISPLTRDTSTLLNLLPTLTPEIMPVPGSNLPLALEQSKSLLSQGGHIKGDIILLADGVSSKQINQAKEVLSGTQYRLSVLALGSKQGAPIRLSDGQLMRDNRDQIVVPQTDYDALNHIASDNGGKLFVYRADGGDLQALEQWLEQSHSTKTSDLQGETWQDLGPYIALLLLLPALLSFRHALAAVACLILLTPPTPAQANSWQHPWQTDNQRAMQAYQQEKYDEAASLFKTPNWQASAHYRNGDYQQALELYEQDSSAKGLYNQGNSLMQLQQFDDAIERYQQALDKQPDFDDAKSNLELAQQLKQQQEQQSDSEDKQQDDQNQQDQQNQQNGQDSQDADQQDGEQNQSQEEDLQSSQDQADSNQQGDQQNSDEQQAQDDQNEPSSENSESSTQANNEAQMSAEPDSAETSKDEPSNATEDESEQQNQQPASMQAEQENGNEPQDEQQAQALSNAIAPEDLPPHMERALGSVIDDPQILLRNKMQLEYQKRRRQGVQSRDNEQW